MQKVIDIFPHRLRPLFYALLIGFLSSVLLSACLGKHYAAPIDSRRQPPSIKITQHQVEKGETIYSIAWRYGLDHKTLAKVNGISYPFIIHPGQKLTWGRSSHSNIVAQKKRKTKVRIASKSSAKSSWKASTSKKASSAKPAIKNNVLVKWRWPSKGKVIAFFSTAGKVNKGIDIEGKLGESVKAAAAGKVVYAGTGLLGYGKLIIIKHNEQYLSAYAHNRVLLVKEGDTVKAGKKIGEMGISGAKQTKLHFEIRRNGKPVNPLKYLPR